MTSSFGASNYGGYGNGYSGYSKSLGGSFNSAGTYTPKRLILARHPTALPTGPRLYRQTKKNVFFAGGPGAAPPGFVRASTSLSEWYFYWAAMKVLDPEQDPRKPPFSVAAYGITRAANWASTRGKRVRRLLTSSSSSAFRFWRFVLKPIASTLMWIRSSSGTTAIN